MFTVRQLIESAYRISGAKGVGETPTAIETADALELLNGILDNFGMEQAFKPGIITREVTSKPDGTVVLSNDGSRVITSVAASAPTVIITTAQPHGLQVNTPVTLQGTKLLDGQYMVAGITSLTSFQIYTLVNGTSYSGTWKRDSESNAYLIDLVTEVPDQILNVVDGTTQLTEYPPQDFYRDRNSGIDNGWYFETSMDPYPTLYLDGQRTVTISYYQPGYRNVNLNTDTDKWQLGMKEAMKWRLASDLAMTNGYQDMSTQCMNRFSEVIAKFRRNHKKLQPYVADTSAPGYTSGSKYDIRTDTFR